MKGHMFEKNWMKMKQHLKTQWNKLSDEDIVKINGKRDLLLSTLRNRYGWDMARAETECHKWELSQGLSGSESCCGEPCRSDKGPGGPHGERRHMDRQSMDKHSIEKHSLDKHSLDKRSMDKQSIDKRSMDKHSVERSHHGEDHREKERRRKAS